MSDFTAQLWLALTQVIPIVGTLIVGGWLALRRLTDGINNETARAISSRATRVGENVTGAAFGQFQILMQAAQAAESDGGPKITELEWKEIRDQMWEAFKSGFGENWLTRAGQVFGIVPFEEDAKAMLESQLVKALDEKRATNAAIRSAPPKAS